MTVKIPNLVRLIIFQKADNQLFHGSRLEAFALKYCHKKQGR